MTHDPLCRFSKKRAADDKYDDCEYCDLIAKVRDDTLSRVSKRVEKVPFIKPGYADWFTHIAGAKPDIVRKDVLAALRGES